MPSEQSLGKLMSPAQAAQQANVSRRTVMRAIESHELKAHRDNRNRWKIAPKDLDMWAGAQLSPSDQGPQKAHTNAHSEDTLKLALHEAENAHLRERISELEKDRDHWRDLAEKLVERPRFSWPWIKR